MTARWILTCAFVCGAASSARGGAGVAGADAFKLPVEARGWGLGTAYSAIADDVGAMAYNPAGLSLVGEREIRLTGLMSMESSLYGSFLGAYPLGRWGAAGVMLLGHHVPEISNSGDMFFPLQGVTTPVTVWDLAYGGYIATRFSHLLPGVRLMAPYSVGLGLKQITLHVASFEASTTAADLGLLAVFDQLRLALVGQNLGGGYTFPGAVEVEADALPSTLRSAVAVVPYEDASSSLTVALENASYIAISSRQKDPVTGSKRRVTEHLNVLGTGVEFWRLKRMGVRLGYVYPWGRGAASYAAGRGLALGGTFRIFTDYATYQFDLAWRPLRIGNNPQDALSISFGLRF